MGEKVTPAATPVKHTTEPWTLGRAGSVVSDATDGECHVHGKGYVGKHHTPAEAEALDREYYGGNALICESVSPSNARRLVACVNLLAGVPTETLELALSQTADPRLAYRAWAPIKSFIDDRELEAFHRWIPDTEQPRGARPEPRS